MKEKYGADGHNLQDLFMKGHDETALSPPFPDLAKWQADTFGRRKHHL